MGTRKHIATQWHQVGGGSILRCKCGEWESDPKDRVRVQRDAHRAHRVEMGEEVAPRRPTLWERLREAEATLARVRDLADVYETNARTVDGVAARNFFELFAEELRSTLEPPQELLDEEETRRHVEP